MISMALSQLFVINISLYIVSDMNARYAPVSLISPPISDMKNDHPIQSRYPIFRTLTPWYIKVFQLKSKPNNAYGIKAYVKHRFWFRLASGVNSTIEQIPVISCQMTKFWKEVVSHNERGFNPKPPPKPLQNPLSSPKHKNC